MFYCELMIQGLRKQYQDVLQASPEAAKLLASLEQRAFKAAKNGTIDSKAVAEEECAKAEQTLAQLRESFQLLEQNPVLPSNYALEKFFGKPIFRTREEAAKDIAEQARKYQDFKRTMDYASSDEIPDIVRTEMAYTLRNTNAFPFRPTTKSANRQELIQGGIDKALDKFKQIVKNPDLETEILKIPGTCRNAC